MRPKFQRSSKGSKSDAGITNIPSRINVLQKDVSDDPEAYVMVSFATTESGEPTHWWSDSGTQTRQPDK
jgi:hypothetical protein